MDIPIFLGAIIGACIGTFFVSQFLVERYRKTLVLCKDMRTPEKLPDGTFVYLVPESDYNEMKEAQLRLIIRDHMIEVKKNKVLTPVPHA